MLSRDLLSDYQYLINGKAKNNNQNSSTPSHKSRKYYDSIDGINNISFVTLENLDKEYYLKGIPIPQKMVTIGGSDDYKLIDAPNIDWNKTYLFWAEQAKSRGVWNNSPVQNEGRDIRSNFYPDYIWPSCGGTSIRVESFPQWADTGLIQNSDDILDILNYLLWRVLSLDYFADNWDNINTQFPEYTRLSIGTDAGWWLLQIEGSDLQLALKEVLMAEIRKYSSMTSGNNFVYTLDPDRADNTTGRINIGTFNIDTNEVMNAFTDPTSREAYLNTLAQIVNENYNILKFGILTNHPGHFSSFWIKINGTILSETLEDPCVKFLPGGEIGEDGTYELGQTTIVNENLETELTNIFIYGLTTNGKFKSVGNTIDEFNQNKINILSNKLLPKTILDGSSSEAREIFSKLDCTESGLGTSVSLSFEQQASTIDPAHKFARKEEDPFLSFTLKKTSNNITGLNLIDDQTGEPWARAESLFVPFRHNEEDKYEIVITYPEGDDIKKYGYNLENCTRYGIYPHFVVKGQPAEASGNNAYIDYLKDCLNNVDINNGQLTGTFEHKAQSAGGASYAPFNYGSVIYENNKYYYVPPRAEDYNDLIDDLTIYIYCLFYYKDNEIPRYINPISVSLTVLLRPDVENKIVFYDGEQMVYNWNSTLQKKEPMRITAHSNWVNKSTTYYTNTYNQQSERDITKIFVDNENDYNLIDSLYTFYRKNEDNEYVETPSLQVYETYRDGIVYYLEDNLHKDKITDYTYSVKTVKLSWNSYKHFEEENFVNSLNQEIDETRYVFGNLCVGNLGGYTGKDSFSETIARSLFTKNVYVDFLGMLPSSLLETRVDDLGEDINYEELSDDAWDRETGLNENRTIFKEKEYLGGYYESMKEQDDLYFSSNMNNVHLNIPTTEAELLNLLSTFGSEPTDTSTTNGNKKFSTGNEFLTNLKYRNGDTIPNTGLKVINNTFNTATENTRESMIRTNLFNLKYTYNPYSVDSEQAVKYELEFRSSTSMLPYENGLVKGQNNIIYNADSDYYYLVFKVSCPAGSNFGSAYKECHGYYFIRIIRASKDDTNITPLIEFVQTDSVDYTSAASYITYSAIHGEETDKEYSFLPIVETPIYLNRCLTANAKSQNSKFKGKQWWFLSGLRNEGSSGSWAQNEIASSCFTICNIGDTYYRTQPDYTLSHANWNYSRYLFPEHGMDIRPTQEDRLSGVNYVQDTVLEYKEIENIGGKDYEMSGPFIYAKYLKKIDELTTEVVPVTLPKVNIQIGLMYGNDEYTNRKIPTTKSLLYVYKKDYDFSIGAYKYELNEARTAVEKKLVHITPTLDSPIAVQVFKYRENFNDRPQIDLSTTKIMTSDGYLWSTYRNQFFILSNEFGGFQITHTPEEGEEFEQEGQNITNTVTKDIFSLYSKFSVAGSTPSAPGTIADLDKVEFYEVQPESIELLFNDPNTEIDVEGETSPSEILINNYYANEKTTPVVIFVSSQMNRLDSDYGVFNLISLNNDNTTGYINTYLRIHFNYSIDGKYNGKDLYIKFELASTNSIKIESSTADISTGD